VGTEYKDALDVTGAGWTGDETQEGGKLFPVLLLHMLEGGGEVGNHLRGSGYYHVMGRQDGERAASCALDRNHDAAGLGDKNIAASDAGIA
jgi:hypothetical protein